MAPASLSDLPSAMFLSTHSALVTGTFLLLSSNTQVSPLWVPLPRQACCSLTTYCSLIHFMLVPAPASPHREAFAEDLWTQQFPTFSAYSFPISLPYLMYFSSKHVRNENTSVFTCLITFCLLLEDGSSINAEIYFVLFIPPLLESRMESGTYKCLYLRWINMHL